MSRKRSKTESGENQGEGDRRAAQRFNETERRFVESERGREKIRSGAPPKTPEEERDLEAAEKTAQRRARENDPEESRDYHKPS